MAPSGKEDKLVIKPIRFDDKWNIKSNFIKSSKDKKLCDIFIETLLQPELWLKKLKDDLRKERDTDQRQQSQAALTARIECRGTEYCDSSGNTSRYGKGENGYYTVRCFHKSTSVIYFIIITETVN